MHHELSDVHPVLAEGTPAELMLKTIADIVAQLITAHDEARDINLSLCVLELVLCLSDKIIF